MPVTTPVTGSSTFRDEMVMLMQWLHRKHPSWPSKYFSHLTKLGYAASKADRSLFLSAKFEFITDVLIAEEGTASLFRVMEVKNTADVLCSYKATFAIDVFVLILHWFNETRDHDECMQRAIDVHFESNPASTMSCNNATCICSVFLDRVYATSRSSR